MSLERKFLIAFYLFWSACIITALPFLYTYVFLLGYIPFLIAPLIVLRNEYSIPVQMQNISGTVLSVVWLATIFYRIIRLVLGDWNYPFSISSIDVFMFYSAWISNALLLSKIKSKRFIWLIIIAELVMNVLFLQRSFVLLWGLTLWLSNHTKLSLKTIFIALLVLIFASLSIVYVRTSLSSNDLSGSVDELKQVFDSSLKRPSFYLRSDEKILSQSNDFSTEYSLKWAFIPRVFNSQKPDLKPGLEVNNQFWDSSGELSKLSHIPVGFLGSHRIHFKSWSWLSISIHILLIILVVETARKWSNKAGWIAYFFVFTQFLIPEHFVFYLTAWVKILPVFMGFTVLNSWYKKKKSIPVLVYSNSSEFGGIQRIVDEIKTYFETNQLVYKTLILNQGIVGKLQFLFSYVRFLFAKPVFISTHIHFNRLLKYRFNDDYVITLLHGIETQTKKASSLIPYSDKLFCNSKRTLESLAIRGEAIQAPYPFLNSLSPVIKKNEIPMFVTVGRMSSVDLYKDYESALAAFINVKKYIPDAEFWVIGKGERLESLTKTYQEEKGIRFLGFVSDDELIEIYQKAWAFILLSSQEGQGLTFFEAMLAGTPVIGLKDSVLSEFIEHEKQGILIDKQHELPDYLRKVAENESYRTTLSENAKEYASKIHQEKLFFTKLMQEIEHVRNSRTDSI
ncbi:glycosyltransferase [bacterium]|nr:MAG: glycosyltransferase [bacterium]